MARFSSLRSLLFLFQSTLLIAGALSVWSGVYTKLLHFFETTDNIPMACIEGWSFVSVCFFTATALSIGFVWSLFVYRGDPCGKSRLFRQKILTWYLGIGSVASVMLAGLVKEGVIALAAREGCVLTITHVPDGTCFSSSLIFLTAFLVAVLIRLRQKAWVSCRS
ncbi:MAG: hypothetical protein H8D63_01075 [Parcubacteria group bacterium]|nr:hypothetical protein [Parcubacteria group bacterium]